MINLGGHALQITQKYAEYIPASGLKKTTPQTILGQVYYWVSSSFIQCTQYQSSRYVSNRHPSHIIVLQHRQQFML